jgi:hypothetical protein
MARPKPHIILEHVEPKTYKVEQILDADGIYAVFYNGKPFNLRSSNQLVSYPGPKYKKSSFSSPAHAFNLAERLNKLFQTDGFQVYRMFDGVPITEDEIERD